MHFFHYFQLQFGQQDTVVIPDSDDTDGETRGASNTQKSKSTSKQVSTTPKSKKESRDDKENKLIEKVERNYIQL